MGESVQETFCPRKKQDTIPNAILLYVIWNYPQAQAVVKATPFPDNTSFLIYYSAEGNISASDLVN